MEPEAHRGRVRSRRVSTFHGVEVPGATVDIEKSPNPPLASEPAREGTVVRRANAAPSTLAPAWARRPTGNRSPPTPGLWQHGGSLHTELASCWERLQSCPGCTATRATLAGGVYGLFGVRRAGDDAVKGPRVRARGFAAQLCGTLVTYPHQRTPVHVMFMFMLCM